MNKTKDLQSLARRVDIILKEELEKASITYNLAEVRIYDVKTVGVQGDERTYAYPVEITLGNERKVIWNDELLDRLSNRIPNEVKGINRVVYTLAEKK